ncbi:transporter substrate-binding domain-containing protein [Alteromonas aestuariivivens]|uniref:transporter substrate-binding domain-containing protein n=1 Tax=Alteromonas aestuariivivens TaxID=1938339 RepID=UPI0011C05DA5|nr:transporter substrate-binding domain-containing protein [Alteromonas aestuariivivens]
MKIKVVLWLIVFCSFQGLAADVVKLNRGHSDKDVRHLYNWEVVNRALELTESEFGSYSIEVTGEAIPNHQRLRELLLNRYLNVAMQLTNEEWEQTIEPIRVPIRFGAYTQRLMLIHKKNADAFKKINTLQDLQAFSAGVRQSWTTKNTLIKNGFLTVPAYSYDALFAMLNKGRFDFLLRGVHEIYPELEARKDEFPDLIIEPHLVVNVPNSHYYIFVSPETPHIKERLTKGLQVMLENNEMKALFDKYYASYFEKAELGNRTEIIFDNP